MLADLSNTLTCDKLTLKCLAKREQGNVANLCFYPKQSFAFLKPLLIKSVLCKSLRANKKYPSPITSPLTFLKYSGHTDIVTPWIPRMQQNCEESLGHLPSNRPDNCVAISEAQG